MSSYFALHDVDDVGAVANVDYAVYPVRKRVPDLPWLADGRYARVYEHGEHQHRTRVEDQNGVLEDIVRLPEETVELTQEKSVPLQFIGTVLLGLERRLKTAEKLIIVRGKMMKHRAYYPRTPLVSHTLIQAGPAVLPPPPSGAKGMNNDI